MAKKKKSKSANKEFTYSVELIGLILVLIAIAGLGFGPVGNFIKGFALFLAGELWFIVLFFIIYIGIYMLWKRQMPKFFTTKMIGVYLILVVILCLCHLEFINKTNGFNEMVKVSYENFMARNDSISSATGILESGDSSIVVGGGLIGGTILGALTTAFSKTGSYVVLAFVAIFAGILTFNINISDILSKLFNKLQRNKTEDEDQRKEYIVEGDELVGIKEKGQKEMAPIKTPKEDIVISTIDEIKNANMPHTEINNKPESDIPIDPEDFTETTTISLEAAKKEFDSTSYSLPKFDLLKPAPKNVTNSEEAYIKNNQATLLRVLSDFGIKGCKIAETHIGPAVTEYEITVPNGTKVNRITNINKEIALAMAAKDVRIQAPIPGKNAIGIEIPNREISSVNFREVLESTQNIKRENKIMVALGKDIMGKSILCDLSKMPHLLVAGSTGSGKSVCINTIIISILMGYKPNDVKLVLVDPKKVELSNYNGIPHLLCPVVTDPKKANATLQKIVSEMEERYDTFAEKEVKNIAGYNEWVEKENKKSLDHQIKKMPYYVVIIDELADLMLVASKEVQDSIMRITQMARAAGIHLIVATQRPSTDIITGVIKNNIPSRIAFAVSSAIDSRTILDASGAEKLLGKGDMLYSPMGDSSPTRVQGCFISDEEIHKIIEYCKTQAPDVKYDDRFNITEDLHSSSSGSSNSDGGDDDPMYNEIVDFAIQTKKISASLIQRRFRFGYNRAARMIDLLEARGVIGPQNGSKPREVLIGKDEGESPSEN